MLVYSTQFRDGGKGVTKWVRIAAKDVSKDQEWFPEEGGVKWFVNKGNPKPLQPHPAGELPLLVCSYILVLLL